MIGRRAVLAAGLAGLAGCATGYRGPAGKLAIAAGERGGLYLAFAELLAAEITAAAPELSCAAVPTAGSVANAERLADGGAQLGLMLVDSAQAAARGLAPFGSAHPLVALGRVYENYLQLVVRADGPVSTFADLAGRAVSLGATGSGAALVGDRLLAVAGLAVAPRVVHHSLADAAAELERGGVDALLWSGGVPTPRIAELDARIGVRLLALDWALPALRERHGPSYDPVRVPPGAYRTVRELPTIGVANLLVCRPELSGAVAGMITEVLVTRADRLVPEQAVGTQFLDLRAIIATADLPLHPGAADSYRRLHG